VAAAVAGDPALVPAAVAEGVAEAAGAWGAALAPRPGGRDPLEGIGPLVAWVRGKGGVLEEQRERLRLGLRVALALHAPVQGSGPPAYATLAPPARRERLAALGRARERVERNVDPAGILEALAVEVRGADAQARGPREPKE
jgi:hypothetical protein